MIMFIDGGNVLVLGIIQRSKITSDKTVCLVLRNECLLATDTIEIISKSSGYSSYKVNLNYGLLGKCSVAK